MSTANKNMVRQAYLEQTRGPVSHPGGELKNLIQHTMGPGSRMSQDVYGDSFVKPPASSSDVFGKGATRQGFRLSKPGR